MAQADRTNGLLEAVLPDTLKFTAQLYAVYPSRKHVSAKVRTFIDFLVQWVSNRKGDQDDLAV